MDTPSTFTLSQALDVWRASLPALPPDDLAELESHLHDSMAELQKTGLSEAEAFLIARRRLGGPAELAEDFEAVPGGPPPRLEPAMHVGRGTEEPRARTRFLVVLGVLGLAASLAMVSWLVVVPKKYSATVLMEIMRTSTISDLGSSLKGLSKPANGSSVSNEEFLPTQFEIVTAKETLAGVAKELKLTERWGLQSLDETSERLRSMVTVKREARTDLLRLTVLSQDKREAAELANEVTEAYMHRRIRLEADSVNLVFATLTQTRKGQELQVDKARRKMQGRAQELNLTDADPEGPLFRASGADQIPLAAEYNKFKEDYQLQLKILREMIDEQEKARLINLMPRQPAIIHEHAVEPTTYSSPNISLWLSVAAVTGVLGAVSLVVGLRRRRETGLPG